jgi:hypothetical protein
MPVVVGNTMSLSARDGGLCMRHAQGEDGLGLGNRKMVVVSSSISIE